MLVEIHLQYYWNIIMVTFLYSYTKTICTVIILVLILFYCYSRLHSLEQGHTKQEGLKGRSHPGSFQSRRDVYRPPPRFLSVDKITLQSAKLLVVSVKLPVQSVIFQTDTTPFPPFMSRETHREKGIFPLGFHHIGSPLGIVYFFCTFIYYFFCITK